MLQTIDILNFRCFSHVSVALKELTVLVGANDTGKTAFLDAILALRARGVSLDDVRFGEANAFIKAQDSEHGFNELRIENHTRVKQPQSTWALGIGPVAQFRLPSSGVQLTSGGQPDADGPPTIGPQGENVPALLDYLLRRDRKRFYKVVDALKNLIPGLEDVDIATPDAATRQINLIVENGHKIDANRASTGVRFLVFFVALAYHPNPPKIILLEEPESGIHPKRLADVMQLMRQVSKAVHGQHPAQVIMTTHSPYLLDLIDLEQDQVLVFRREPEGHRSVTPAAPERLKNFLDEFLLGEVWYNEGENGLLASQS